MTVKLFQDVAGTIPAVLPGQPVGFIKRTKGSDDAKQATALSKPTLARQPKAGVRNIATYGSAFGNASVWRDTSISGGITFTKEGVGRDIHGNYVQYSAVGVATATWAGTLYNAVALTGRPPAASGESATTRAKGVITRGTLRAGLGIAVEASGVNAAGSYVEGAHSVPYRGSVVQDMIYTVNLVNPSTELLSANASIRGMTVGEAIDFSFKIYDLQLERGAVPTPVQFNYGPNDITEPGVPDLWHLYNDGGDSLNATLAAGTYGLASIGIDRQIVIGTFVSDGTTPVNILRHERQLDVSYRLGAYSAAEELAIRDVWGRKYA